MDIVIDKILNMGAGGIIIGFVMWFLARWFKFRERKNGYGPSTQEILSGFKGILQQHAGMLDAICTKQKLQIDGMHDHARESREGFQRIEDKISDMKK